MTIVQLNDVYEITPLAGGRWGGPARVASVLEQLEAANPHTFAVLAGDLLSPSALGTAEVDGERLDGKQMVAVLNAMGLDFATFGNHEFDLREGPFLARLRESAFEWTSANVTTAAGAPFNGVSSHAILTATNGAGQLRVALIGVTMDRDAPGYARIADPIDAARRMASVLEDSADVIVAVTHQTLARDIELAQTAAGIDMILGGHEHENLQLQRGETLTPITKADANARTVWVHEITLEPRTRQPRIESRLVPITDAIPEQTRTAQAARRWVDAAYAGFRRSGFEPDASVAEVPVALDGLESSVRNRSTDLSRLIVEAMHAEVAGADGAVVNGGSIRVDDVLRPGPLTQYDIIRVLPFGGPIVEIEVTGAFLQRVLDQGVRNRGGGGFLHHSGIEAAESGWRIAGTALDPSRTYRIAISDFLLTGREQGLDFLTRTNADLRVVREHRDVRLALIDEIRRRWPPGPP
ncbi:MAG: bifunctional metallophosphatase/5'-nucleotidase [Gemmatimonadetes bacterium]|nr:bifunctional metallophosphatase/5'-nucleotidase [Gemmatimonadota bacterium]